MKKFILVLVTLFSITFGMGRIQAVESVNSSEKIYDYGNLLTETEKLEIKDLIMNFINTYKLDMVVVTQRNYYGDLKSYAQDFYDYNDFGEGKTNDGILLALNADAAGYEAQIVTTGEGIRMYDDERIQNLLSSMSYVKADGAGAIVKKFVNLSSSYANQGIPASNKNTYIDENGNYRIKRKYPVFKLGLIAVIVSTVILLILINKNKMVKKASNAKEYLDNSSISIVDRKDQFLRTNTTSVVIATSDGGSSGGGGSSISSGSSGVSHGGGGGRL